MARTLILVRHAKSDWSAPVDDQHRPLARRGRRQAPATRRWLAEHLPAPELVLVSVAVRAQQTWELLASELPVLPPDVPVHSEEAVYTFSGKTLGQVVASLPAHLNRVLLVGHNPALEELLEHLTAQQLRLTTSALAVVDLPGWDARTGHLRAFGRPADETVRLAPPVR